MVRSLLLFQPLVTAETLGGEYSTPDKISLSIELLLISKILLHRHL
jgi:hypothetical protein